MNLNFINDVLDLIANHAKKESPDLKKARRLMSGMLFLELGDSEFRVSYHFPEGSTQGVFSMWLLTDAHYWIGNVDLPSQVIRVIDQWLDNPTQVPKSSDKAA